MMLAGARPVWLAGMLALAVYAATAADAYAIRLLTVAGIWALMSGVTDLVRAFQIRKLKDV